MPTALLFIVLVLAYQFLVQGPLTAALKERRARTEGAVEAAHKAIATERSWFMLPSPAPAHPGRDEDLTGRTATR